MLNMDVKRVCEEVKAYPNTECEASVKDECKSARVDFYPFGYLSSLELICKNTECFIVGDVPIPKERGEKVLGNAKRVFTDKDCFLKEEHTHYHRAGVNIHIHPVCHDDKGVFGLVLQDVVAELILKGKEK